MKRDRIQPNMSVPDIVKTMCKSNEDSSGINPGAMSAINHVTDEVGLEKGFTFLLRLDSLEIYGSDIWLGYSDCCEKNATRFYESVMNSDKEMLEYIENYPDV